MSDASKESDNNLSASDINLGTACFRCRGFRHACDRKKPSCSRCQRRGIECNYPEAAPTLKKLQKATETLGDRIRKFGDKLKAGEGVPKGKDFRRISLQRLAQNTRSTVAPVDVDSPSSILSDQSDARSSMSTTASTAASDVDEALHTMASTSDFSVYPCSKCFKDLQQCDLLLPSCTRCSANEFACVYTKTEPKANHVSQVLSTMNKVMDQWQDSLDKMAKDFAQKTRDLSQKANNSFKRTPLPPFTWKITSTNKGLSVESNVNSYNDLSKLVDQFKRTLHISPRDDAAQPSPSLETASLDSERHRLAQQAELDDTSSIHTASSFPFAVWNAWSQSAHALPQDYPIDITPELTDNLVDLYCRTPCCSAIRLPIIDTPEFLQRYQDPNPTQRPSTVLVYAVCAMAARNAFQQHVWSKRLAQDAPAYNMGKALSMAYCLKARELLADCFDQPTMDHCQAAFLLSYCNQQNGYPGVIYIYEWIAFTMAQEMGLYDEGRTLTRQESNIVWCLYYYNTWYRVLQGDAKTSAELNQFCPRSPLPEPPPKPDSGQGSHALINHYVWSVWHYLIKLQTLRHEVMSRLLVAQSAGKNDTTLPIDLLAMQDRIQDFYDQLPPEWQHPDLDVAGNVSSPDDSQTEPDMFNVHLLEFIRSCILIVHVYYNINKILLYQAFFPSDHLPTSPFSIQCLSVSIDAAHAISRSLEVIISQHSECHTPLLGFLFANIVYIKLLNYNDDQYVNFAQQSLRQSVDLAKNSQSYLYDYEMSKTLVNIMEQDVRAACRRADSFDTASLDSTWSSIASTNNHITYHPNHTPSPHAHPHPPPPHYSSSS